ncbi:hypothetical protein [Brevibacterium litoralis]|uniref:hypothetical protein n=1 Tax=Brevibacterium litoralis TaxID=3138935 RepID=UPI0032EDCF1F
MTSTPVIVLGCLAVLLVVAMLLVVVVLVRRTRARRVPLVPEGTSVAPVRSASGADSGHGADWAGRDVDRDVPTPSQRSFGVWGAQTSTLRIVPQVDGSGRAPGDSPDDPQRS